VGGTPLTGGIGSIQGTILGAFITTVLSNGMNMLGEDAFDLRVFPAHKSYNACRLAF
jgi:ribose/xylose/arabinose/galactoside ABC-type transport system permease subunit